jgi:hypothetical protein
MDLVFHKSKIDRIMLEDSKLNKVNIEAWSDGQIQSKLWLCRELEKVWSHQSSQFWIYGSWYGLLPQMLLQREKLSIRHFQLFDIDSNALEISKKINFTWEIQKIRFDHHTIDCNTIDSSFIEDKNPDLIINTSCEHFENYNWFYKIPKGQDFLIQSTDMIHPTHTQLAHNLEHFENQVGAVSEIYFKNELLFDYPKNGFKRFMIIGKK